MKILIVDDETRTCKVWRKLLEQAGHEVETCGTCREALALTREGSRAGPWDAVLLDLELPDGSGDEVVPHVCNASVRSIAITSAYLDDERSLALQQQGLPVILKPVRRPTLLALVEFLAQRATANSVLHDAAAELGKRHRLSPAETRVVGLVVLGLSNDEVAEQLGCSKRTVNLHLGRVFAKLGVHDRRGVVKQVVAGLAAAADG